MRSKHSIFIAIIVLLSTLGLTTIIYYTFDVCYAYTTKLQVPFFTGFLTLGSFLLTLKIFIIVQLKDKLYESNEYINKVAELRLVDNTIKLFAPLTRLAELLLIAVIMAISTAFIQITVGFIGKQFSAAICISFAIVTLCLVVFAWWHIRKNIFDLFEYASKDNEKLIAEAQKQLLKN